MARNGSGLYTVPNTMVAGTTITASDHNENYADLGSEITNSVAADGQTPMTGALKVASGTVSLPGLSFSSDTDTGFYRIGANNLGVAIGGAKVADFSTTGLAITGTFSATGAAAWTGQVSLGAGALNSDGTVALPAYSFTSDPDCGLYRVGANNLGVAVNGEKVLDVATTGLSVVGSVTVSSGFTVSAGSVSLPATSIAGAALNSDVFATQAQMEAAAATAVAANPALMKHHPLMPKAWAYFTISGATATLQRGVGFSVATRPGGGTWEFTMSTAMSDTNYGVFALPKSGTIMPYSEANFTRTTTVFRLDFTNIAGSPTDPLGINVFVFGDQ